MMMMMITLSLVVFLERDLMGSVDNSPYLRTFSLMIIIIIAMILMLIMLPKPSRTVT